MIEGIDVSSHQGTVDHQAVSDSGMKFCICKATEGRDWADSKFATNINAIRAVDAEVYIPGAYHYARPDSVGGAEDGRAEAEDFCDLVEAVCGDITQNFMPPALDFEKYSESDYEENIPWIKAWLETVETRLKRRPMIYTGKNVWRYEVGGTSLFTDYALWQVDYTDEPEPESMETDPAWLWTLWQYSAGGQFQHHAPVPGVGIVDVNRFRGSLEELIIFGSAAPAPQSWPSPPRVVDLNDFRGAYSEYVARVQGLLLSHQYGPDGLTKDGKVDGLMGDKTQAYLRDFKSRRALAPDTIMDWATWWALTYDRLTS